MNRAEFLDIIKNEGFMQGMDVSGLDELVKLYPWFQSAYSVILNDLFRSGSFSFESNLKKSAIYIADREVLYYLLNGKAIIDDNNSGIPVIEEAERAITSESTEEIPEVRLLQNSDSSTGRTREELVNEINKRLAEIENRHRSDTILVLEDEVINRDQIEEKVELEPLVGINTDLLDLDYPSDNVDEEYSSVGQKGTEDKESDLVDRFLEINPRIEAKADTSVTRLEDITENIDDRAEGLVSETLAGIYLNQKYYTKAILIYEKLCLKYPEKSSYFATQIEKIKELIS